MAALAVGGLALVAAVAIAVAVASDPSTAGGGEDDDSSDEPCTPGPIRPEDDGRDGIWQTACGAGDAFRIDLLGSWRYRALGGTANAVGSRTYPLEPERAAHTEAMAATIGPGRPELIAIDDRGLGIGSGLVDPEPFAELVTVESSGGATDLDTAADDARAATERAGDEVVDEGRLDGAAGEVAWIEASIARTPGITQLRYLLVDGDRLWTVVWSTDEPQDQRPFADATAASLDPR